MKKFYFILITLLVGVAVWAQPTKTWNGGNGAWNIATNWTPAGVPAANSRIVFDDGSTAIISNVPVLSINRLTVTGNTNITLRGATLTINNSSAVEFVITDGSSVELSTGVNIRLAAGARASIAGTLLIGSGRIYNTDNAGSVTTVTPTGIIENRGVISSTDVKKLRFQSGATYNHARNGGTIPTATWNDNSNCNITGTINTRPSVASFDQEFGNFTWNAPNQNSSLSLLGRLKNIDGDFSVITTGSGNISLWDLNFGGNLLVDGDYIHSGGTLVMINSVGLCVLELSGNFNMSGGTLTNNGPSCFFAFNKAGLQTYTKTGGTISGQVNFLVNSTSTVDFGTYVLDGTAATFRLNTGAKIITANPDGLTSTGAVGTIQVGGLREYSSDAIYEFQGASTGIFTTTTHPGVREMIINNTTGNVTLAQPMTINTRLTLTDGELNTTATNIITIADNATATGFSNNSFVNGPMVKVGNDRFTFPVGKSGEGIRKIGITLPVGTSDVTTSFTAEFLRNDPNSVGTTLGAGLARVSGCEYWTLDRAGTNNVRVVLSWESDSPCNNQPYVTQLATLRVARWNGTTWVNEGRQTTTGDATSGTITSIVVNNFSPFALASSSATENPLPVVFGDVKAYEKNNGVQIEWSNLTEKDVAEYTVERSANGSDFSAIAQQLPTSNQNDRADYDAFDAAPLQGINYYRIKAVETTGKIVYSKVLSVSLGNITQQNLRLYPNPVSGNQVTISLSNVRRGQYNLRVVNTAGQDIYNQAITNQGSTTTQTINLPSSIKPGVYNMIITGSDYRENKMFIVQ